MDQLESQYGKQVIKMGLAHAHTQSLEVTLFTNHTKNELSVDKQVLSVQFDVQNKS